MKPRQVIMLAAAAIILGLYWFTYTTHREPHYKGKSLTEWLVLYAQINGRVEHGTMSEKPADAVRHIGTNAVPFLVTWVERPDMPPWKQRLFRMAYRWKAGTLGRDALLKLLHPQPTLAERTICAFMILGPTARAAVPNLVRVARNGDRSSADLATICLGYLGIDAFPPLLSLLTNTANAASPHRFLAMNTLSGMGYLGTNAHPGIVLLIHWLDDPKIAPLAAAILGRLRLESDISVPALIECTRSTNVTVRQAATLSLGQFGRSARASAAPVLTKLLDDPDVSVRNTAKQALELIAPEVSAP